MAEDGEMLKEEAWGEQAPGTRALEGEKEGMWILFSSILVPLHGTVRCAVVKIEWESNWHTPLAHKALTTALQLYNVFKMF